MADWRQLRTLAGVDPPSGEEQPYSEEDVQARKLPVHQPAPPDDVLHRIWRMVAKDPSSVMPSPGMITVLPETVPIFQKAMQEAEVLGNTGNPLVDKAHAFLATRYPRFASQVPVYPAMEGALPGNTQGMFYNAGRPYVHLNTEVLARQSDPLGAAIQTLAHEMTHARQMAKMGSLKMAEQHAIPYAERPIEKFARMGGRTAWESYVRYLEHLAGLTGEAGK